VSVTTARGFKAAAARAGLKRGGELDVAVVIAEEGPVPAAGLFTRNRAAAAPVLISRQRLVNGSAQAVLLNSGCANAGTGTRGRAAAEATTAALAMFLGASPDDVLAMSTGPIGSFLDGNAITEAIPRLVSDASAEGGDDAARAIMTTDSRPKTVAIAGEGFTVGGMAKGAGMLRPDLATMLRLWAQTGMRAGEVCGLQWQDVDLEAGTALVRRTWSRQRLGPTKTGIICAVSFLHPTTETTAEWRPGVTAESRALLTGLRRLTVRSLEPSAFVFGGGATPIHSMDLHRDWKRVLGAAKVRYRSPEQLRHTFASTMLSRNAPLLYVQKAGGWRSASVLLRVYARWVPEGVESVAALQPVATQAQPAPLVGA